MLSNLKACGKQEEFWKKLSREHWSESGKNLNERKEEQKRFILTKNMIS